MIHVDPPFDLGETLKGTDDAGALINSHWQGAVYEFPDVDRTPGTPRGGKGRRNGGTIKAVCVRNTKGSALTVATATYGMALSFDVTAAGRLAATTVKGAALADEGEWCGVGDPELGTTTVADDDLFWLVIGGVVPLLSEDTITAGHSFIADAGALGDVIAAAAADVGGHETMGVALDAGADGAVFLAMVDVMYG